MKWLFRPDDNMLLAEIEALGGISVGHSTHRRLNAIQHGDLPRSEYEAPNDAKYRPAVVPLPVRVPGGGSWPGKGGIVTAKMLCVQRCARLSPASCANARVLCSARTRTMRCARIGSTPSRRSIRLRTCASTTRSTRTAA